MDFDNKRYWKRRKSGLRGQAEPYHEVVCILPGEYSEEGKWAKEVNRQERRDRQFLRGKYLLTPAKKQERWKQRRQMKGVASL